MTTPRRWLLVTLLGLVAVALIATESAMNDSGPSRLTLTLTFAAVATLTAGAAAVLPRVTMRLRSVRHAVLLTAVAAVVVAAISVVAAAQTMFLSPEDLRLVLIALALGVGLGVVLAEAITQPLREDLDRIQSVASAVAAGDLSEQTGVRRPDEVGQLARALDEMVAQLTAARAEQQRIEAARSDFLAAVGHDLRTPITAIRSAVEAMQDGLADDPDAFLQHIRRDLQFMGTLVDDLFLLATLESGGHAAVRERQDLREIADETVESLSHVAAERRVRVVLDAAGPVPVEANARELGRVLRNLVDNAIRHAPDGSTVTVALARDDARASVAVCDEGPGFDATFVDRAFESFTRADASRRRDGSGAGLGLAIARGLVEAHGGAIRAEAGPGGRVTVELPAA